MFLTGETTAQAFARQFGRPPAGVWVAPGRVNLIGEHTDYSQGYVLPLAIPQRVTVAAAPRADGRLVVRSLQRRREVRLRVAALVPGSVRGWAAYPAGVAWSLISAGYEIDGADLLVDGAVPPGAGLSSSAAMECATALALLGLAGITTEPPQLALLCQRAENEFVGVPCGVMDQMASLICEPDAVLLLDCRTLRTESVPFPLTAWDATLLVIDTRAPHRLVGGEYAARRRDCEEAARLLGVPALRDIRAEDLERSLARLRDGTLRRRVRHVVTENARVLTAVDALRGGDLAALGRLLTASHASLRDNYEVSCAELDTAVEAALGAGALGARMTGGGFGGSAIALVSSADVEAVTAAVTAGFARAGWRRPPVIFPVVPSAGAHPVRQ